MKRIQESDASSVLMATVVKAFDQVKKADFIFLNTLLELEPSPLSALNQLQPSYAIGPINFLSHSTTTDVERSLFRESDCSAWLDSKPTGSVLYISFGSISEISKHEVGEIARGLVQSEVSFLWVVKSDGGGEFDGFFDRVRVRGRGLIVPWCNQTRVLSHPAVVGFLTHCGWNSILESVWHGVPMICRPILFDQPMNRKLVVEDWKVGIDLCDGGEVSEEEVVGKIKVLMKGEKGCDLRKQIDKMSKTLRNALDANGCSQRSFDQFVQDLKDRASTLASQ